MKKFTCLLVALVLGALGVHAEEEERGLRLASGLSVKSPELLQLGQCVRYQEGGIRFFGAEQIFWVQGKVLSLDSQIKSLITCASDWLPGVEPPTRKELLRREQQMPCLLGDGAERPEVRRVMVRIAAEHWETPWDSRWSTKGRLFRGMYLEQQLRDGEAVVIDSALLSACE